VTGLNEPSEAEIDFALVRDPGARLRRRLAERVHPFALGGARVTNEVLDRGAVGEFAPDVPGKTTTGRRIRLNRRFGLALLGLMIVGGIAWYGWNWWEVGRFIETTDDAYVGGNVTTLSPHVAGFVPQILVRDNQFVKAGQLVVTLDDRDYKASLAHAEAVVQNQLAALTNLHAKYALQQSMIAQAEDDLAAKKATAAFARVDAARCHALALTTFGTAQADQKAFAAERNAAAAVRAGEASVNAAKQQLRVIDTEITETRASLAEAQADLRTTQLNLGYTRIRSPIDGYVGNRAAQIGAYP
jgi:membrane fusion protein, multidrug efflux system